MNRWENCWRTKKLCYLFQKKFPALQTALHGSGPVPRDRGAASEPALLKPSPACKQLSNQQVPSPALHRCSTGADQSLAAAQTTPSLPNGQNFIFSKKKKVSEYKIWGENVVKTQKTIVPLKKYLHTAQIPSKGLFGRPPFRIAIQCRNVQDFKGP